ncbi:MAG: SDR family NAD(P)-dependent oxidoreductase [Verrucomicrobia bacterium]|nr:MAG: SDR family NAD(P)-dependent oxidoreductase [Verrucomicrobiota bacterium]
MFCKQSGYLGVRSDARCVSRHDLTKAGDCCVYGFHDFAVRYPIATKYSAAKLAYLGAVRSLATEVSQHGVRVNAVVPG